MEKIDNIVVMMLWEVQKSSADVTFVDYYKLINRKGWVRPLLYVYYNA